MSTLRIYKTLLFLVCLAGPVWAQSAAEKLEKAWASEDKVKASALYADGIWEEGFGQDLFQQVVGKKLQFKLIREHGKENRVVAIYDVWQEGKRVDRIFTFFVDDQVWAHTETKDHAIHFYEGNVPPILDLKDIEGTREMSSLGHCYLKGRSTGQSRFDLALKEGGFELKRSYVLLKLGRALLVYGDDEYVLVMERENGVWNAVDEARFPSVGKLLFRIQGHEILAE